MMQTPQVATSQFTFAIPNIIKTKKIQNKEKKKWVDNKPFYGGFNKETKNKQSSQNK
jgi:hypothetical protein